MARVPFSYNRRSLWARGSSTLLTVLSIGATVAVLAGMLALQQGFAVMFTERGRTDLAVFLRLGANSEGESAVPLDRAQIMIKGTPEIAEGADGQPLASAELFLAVRLFKADSAETNVALRGVQPRTFDIHGAQLRILSGRRFAPGADEVIVGRSLVGRLRDGRLGDVLMLNTTPFKVVGTFTATGQHDSEIWGDADRLREALERPMFSRVLAALRPGTDVEALAARLAEDKQTPAKVMTERAYLEAQTGALSGMFVAVGMLLGILMGVAAVFTGTNSMLAAVAARSREIGIMLALGFRPAALFVAFLLEAALLGLLGGALGCLLALPLNGIETGTTNMQTFSEVAFSFRITPFVLGTAVAFALLLGVLGGAVPAWRAARLVPTEALRRA
jgi:ABC-type lipoprotein release transport system permease subunit